MDSATNNIEVSENALTGYRPWHVESRYHFVREFIEDGCNKIVFVNLAENYSVLSTKIVIQELYERHMKKFLKTKEITVPVDCHRIARLLEISFTINYLVYIFRNYPLGIKESSESSKLARNNS
jgi:hypothetical protein